MEEAFISCDGSDYNISADARVVAGASPAVLLPLSFMQSENPAGAAGTTRASKFIAPQHLIRLETRSRTGGPGFCFQTTAGDIRLGRSP